MFQRYNNCRGIKLFKLGRWQAELWYCPHAELIPPHVHPNIDSKLVILGGSMMGSIGTKTRKVGWRDFLRSFPIPRNVSHSAVITGPFCLFMNIEHWVKGNQVSSAAIDFESV